MGFSRLETALVGVTAILGITLIIVVAVWASEGGDSDGGVSLSSSGERTAHCMLIKDPLNGPDNLTGTVMFTQSSAETDLSITVDISGLDTTSTTHGFHVHQLGKLSPDCRSCGGHYNPKSVNHAGPTDDVRHVGDFGNLEQTSSGNISKTFTDPVASLYGEYSIIGRAIVLHAGADDLGQGGNAGSLASGNAGPRLACCVIGWATST